MQAQIINFRRGRRTQTNNQMVLKVAGINNKEKAAVLVNKEVIFKTQTGKDIKGKITAIHGNSGAVRAIFERGMPGQAIAKHVEII